MRSSKPAYLMAMLAGLVIVGASTGGVVAATHHHDQAQIEAQSAAQAGPPSSDPAQSVGVISSAAAATSAPAAISPTGIDSAAPATSAAATPTTAAGPTTAGTTTAGTTTAAAPATPTSATPQASTSAKAAGAVQKFKNGTYSATGSYNSPGGIEKLGVTITLAADKVTKSDLDLLGGAGLSHSFQTAFASGYSGQVVGKDISTIKLGAVSGSSLTGMGFNAAITQIETQAKVSG